MNSMYLHHIEDILIVRKKGETKDWVEITLQTAGAEEVLELAIFADNGLPEVTLGNTVVHRIEYDD